MTQKAPQAASFLPDFCGTRSVFVVVLVAELLAIVLTLAQVPHGANHLYNLAMYSLFIQWIALACIAGLCLSQPYLGRLSDYWTAALSYGLTLLITLGVTEVAWWILGNWPIQPGHSSQGHGLFLLKSMGISAIVCALALRYFYVQHQWRRRTESEATARFAALQARIRPHFLFNCMNTIASLTRKDPTAAEEATEDLAELFRASLQDIHSGGALTDELALCERYLRIEQHRLGERLRVDWQLDAMPAAARLPLLSLQPLVENAIYHGIEPLADGGTIRITAQNLGQHLRITVQNPLPEKGRQAARHDGNQLAQENIARRLSAFFGDEASLTVRADSDHYHVQLDIPYAHEDPDR